jgi:hypothetical protein
MSTMSIYSSERSVHKVKQTIIIYNFLAVKIWCQKQTTAFFSIQFLKTSRFILYSCNPPGHLADLLNALGLCKVMVVPLAEPHSWHDEI